jgi:hypothetical protein
MPSVNLEKAWKRLHRDQRAQSGRPLSRKKLMAAPMGPSLASSTGAGVQRILAWLGCYDGPTDGNLRSPQSLQAIQWFQSDNGLGADGIVGPKTAAKIDSYDSALSDAPPEMKACRRWRLTHYYISDQNEFSGERKVPVFDNNGTTLALVEPGFFAQMSLEGTGKLRDGRLLNVTGKTIAVSASDYAGVLENARRNGFIPNRPGYAGIVIAPSGSDYKVVKALTFSEVKNKGTEGYGVQNGLPLEAWKTLAADLGRYSGSSEPKFVGKGGLVPVGTKVWILGLGWFTVNDTGGGIFGAHFDIFTGTPAKAKLKSHPPMGYIWYRGVEQRIPVTYSYGHAQKK